MTMSEDGLYMDGLLIVWDGRKCGTRSSVRASMLVLYYFD